jgi:hypothetical protein
MDGTASIRKTLGKMKSCLAFLFAVRAGMEPKFPGEIILGCEGTGRGETKFVTLWKYFCRFRNPAC